MQETDVVLKKTEDDHVLTEQTSVMIELTSSYDNEAFILDLTLSSNKHPDNIIEVGDSK